MGSKHRAHLVSRGVGAAATAYEKIKRATYPEYARAGPLKEKYVFLPFIMEATGGFGKTARYVMRELRKRQEMRTCSLTVLTAERPDPLKISLAMDLARQNASMVIEREPIERQVPLGTLARADNQIASWKDGARQELQIRTLVPGNGKNSWKNFYFKNPTKLKKGASGPMVLTGPMPGTALPNVTSLSMMPQGHHSPGRAQSSLS